MYVSIKVGVSDRVGSGVAGIFGAFRGTMTAGARAYKGSGAKRRRPAESLTWAPS